MGNGQHILLVLTLLCSFQTQCESQLNHDHFLCHPDQSRALLQFKSNFVTDPSASSECEYSGEGIRNSTTTWNESTDCCSSWDGVTCNVVTGQVIGLDLSCNMLRPQLFLLRRYGIFSSLFASIPNLQMLNLAYNDFKSVSHDQFSISFASLPPSLTHLNLSVSAFNGYIPSHISHLSKLVSLDLSGNHDLRFESATVLKSMARNLTRLRVLHLEGTSLLAFPDSASCLMNLSSSLTFLSLHDSGLQGTFPESFLLLPNLLVLDLSVNVNLSGSLPKRSNSTSLRVLDLSETGLFGVLPADSIDNLKSLQVLYLGMCNFSGSIPTSLGNLTQITELSLHYNHFSGAIPSSLGHLTQLHDLNLGWNTLTGQIPNAILNLTQLDGSLPTSRGQPFPNLSYFDLSSNSLNGPIPSWLFALPLLTELRLSNNYLSGPLSEFMSPSLSFLDLSNNKLNGLVSSPISRSLDIEYLDLNSNLLEGSIPVPSLRAVRFMSVAHNSFTGAVPSLICNASSLELLDLSSNSLSGMIPRCLGNVSSSLLVLNMCMNNFHGTIPDTFAKGSELTFLNLNGNQLGGVLPRSLAYCENLEALDLNNNSIVDVFPRWMGNLQQLQVLVLRSNKLYGHVDIDVKMNSSFPMLRILDLSNNNFSGVLPSNLLKSLKEMIEVSEDQGEPQYMGTFHRYECRYSVSITMKGVDMLLVKILTIFTIIDMSNNKFDGNIPLEFGSLYALKGLNLSHNYLAGPIPPSFGKLVNLEWLDLSSNKLVGRIPIPSPATFYFSVSNNSFTGHVPSLICNASSLELLDLSFNGLSGMIPQCLGNISTSLVVLKLCMNNFHGTIPDTFANCSRLTFLNLNGNQLGGGLPRSLANCEMLEALDVDNNYIVDVFPRWMQNLQQLQVLVLRSNKLYGRVDIDLKMNYCFPMLRILDLSNNNFSGPLPSRLVKRLKGMIKVSEYQGEPEYMGTSHGQGYRYSVSVTMKGVDMKLEKILTIFTTIDMSNNKFDGNIPLQFGSLHSLKGLNLSNNCLAGPIPPSFGKLVNLEWLDLSSNKLVGRIPTQLLDLNSLAVLNLSHNHLHGAIPTGKQFNTFKGESYVGNSGLCGFPLPKCGSENSSPPTQSASSDESESTFSWKSSYVGYGCGTLFGMAMGYLVFSTGSPHWFVKMVDGERQSKTRRIRRNANARGRGRSEK